MDKTNTKDITPHCSNAMLCAAFIPVRKWVSIQLIRLANKVYKEKKIVPIGVSLKIEEVKDCLSQAVKQGLISQEEVDKICGCQWVYTNNYYKSEEQKKEVKEYKIPKDGMHIFEFEGRGKFATHSNTLWSAWEKFTECGSQASPLSDLASTNKVV